MRILSLARRVEQAGLQYSLVGGLASPDYYVTVAAAMASTQDGRAHLKLYETIVPWLVQASQRAYPHSLFTKARDGCAGASRHGGDCQEDCGGGGDQ